MSDGDGPTALSVQSTQYEDFQLPWLSHFRLTGCSIVAQVSIFIMWHLMTYFLKLIPLTFISSLASASRAQSYTFPARWPMGLASLLLS